MADRPEPQDAPDQLLAQYQLVQRELERMDRRMQAIETQMLETQQAMAALQALGELGDTEALVPLGAGVHVRARVDGKAPVLMPIGAGYSTEADAATIAKALEARVASINQAFEDASQQAQQLAQVAATLQERMGGA